MNGRRPVQIAVGPEKRLATFLRCDIVDSTRLLNALALEDQRALTSAFRAAVARVAAREGGHVMRYEGDGAQLSWHIVGASFRPDPPPTIGPVSQGRPAATAAHRVASGTGRLVRAWRGLPHERRLAAYAAFGLFIAPDQFAFAFHRCKQGVRFVRIAHDPRPVNVARANARLECYCGRWNGPYFIPFFHPERPWASAAPVLRAAADTPPRLACKKFRRFRTRGADITASP